MEEIQLCIEAIEGNALDCIHDEIQYNIVSKNMAFNIGRHILSRN